MGQVNQSKRHAYNHTEPSEMAGSHNAPVDNIEQTKDVNSCELSLKAAPCSSLVSRNITVLGHRTSVRLEPEM